MNSLCPDPGPYIFQDVLSRGTEEQIQIDLKSSVYFILLETLVSGPWMQAAFLLLVLQPRSFRSDEGGESRSVRDDREWLSKDSLGELQTSCGSCRLCGTEMVSPTLHTGDTLASSFGGSFSHRL